MSVSVSDASALVPIAVIIGAHGLRGDVRVKLLNPASELLSTRSSVLLRNGAGARTMTVLSARRQPQGLMLLSIEGCHDRDAAIALRGGELCVPRAELPALDADEHYLIDLVGLEVRLEDGTVVGVVEQTMEYPAAQVLRVRVAAGVVEVPLLEPYFVAIDDGQRAVIVRHFDELDVERV